MKIRHAGILVTDIGLSMEFYRELGFDFQSRWFETWDGKGLEICKMKDDNGAILELIRGDWYPHIALTVAGLDKNKLYQIHDRITAIAKVKFVTDPDGNVIELVEEL